VEATDAGCCVSTEHPKAVEMSPRSGRSSRREEMRKAGSSNPERFRTQSPIPRNDAWRNENAAVESPRLRNDELRNARSPSPSPKNSFPRSPSFDPILSSPERKNMIQSFASDNE
jgi:hypothetical protein